MRLKQTITILLVSLAVLATAQTPDKFIINYPGKTVIRYGKQFSIKVKDSTAGKIQVLLFDTIEDSTSSVNFDISVYNTTLTISPKSGNITDYTSLPEFIITTPQISEITFNTAGLVKLTGQFSINKLTINNKGAGVIKILSPVSIKNLIIKNNGAGIINIDTGTPVAYAKIKISGAGIFNANSTPISNLDAIIQGASYCSVRVTDNLVAKVTGFSYFTYYGNPKYKKIVSDGLVIINHKP